MSAKLAIITDGYVEHGYSIVESLCQTRRFDGDVYLTSPFVGRGMAAVQRLNAQGLTVKFHELNIKYQFSINKLRDFVKKNYDGINLLVNYAAIPLCTSSNSQYPDVVMDVALANYRRLRKVCDTLFPLLLPGARVVNVSRRFTGNPEGYPMVSLNHVENLRLQFSSPTLTVDELDALVPQFLDRRKVADYRRDHTSVGGAYAGYKVAVSALSNVLQRQLEADARRRDIVVDTIHPGFNYVNPTTASEWFRSDEQLETHLYGLRGAVAGRQGWQLPWFY